MNNILIKDLSKYIETKGKSELSKAEFHFSELVREQTVYISGIHITRVGQFSPLPI